MGGQLTSLGVIVCLMASGCSWVRSTEVSAQDPESNVAVTVMDDKGQRLDGAAFDPVGDVQPMALGPGGAVTVRGPTAGVVSLGGYLPEPVVLDPSQPAREVTLFSRTAADGTPRVALHFAGDTMMGRRYQQPTREGTPVVNDAAEARAVVAAVAPLIAAADASTVNAETVVGALPADQAYPGKRYLLQSPPALAAALTDMGIDLVALGNNHVSDWRDAGVASTLRELTAAGLPSVGGGLTAEDAERGQIIAAGPLRLGVVSMTTVNGDFVNDSLPGADVAPPANLPAEDAWQYAERTFSFGKPGEQGYLERASRRPAEWWRLFQTAEPTMDAARTADLWAALTAPGAVPELQDWVARRGHGGAAKFSTPRMAAAVADLRRAGADLVVMQLHGGYMFSEVPSSFIRRISRSAIDAGADMVVNHHPHVLQGFEWYKGKLIAFSLGNLVFDQDFAATFPSMFVRAVFEGSTLLKARLVPVLLDDYRPIPLSGAGNERLLQMVDERSAIAALSDRTSSGRIVTRLDPSVVPNAAVDVRDGVVLTERRTEPLDVTLDAAGFARVGRCAVLRPSVPTLEYGTDLLTWGGFDDVLANGAVDAAPRFELHGDAVAAASEERERFLELDARREFASVRPLAHAELVEHRRYGVDGRPLDSAAQYRLQFDARLAGRGPIIVRTGWYAVDDSDPNEQPESTLLAENEAELTAPKGRWQTLTLDLPDPFATDGAQPDAVSVSIVLPGRAGTLGVDNVELYEWRKPVPALAGQWLAVDAVRGAPGASVTLEASGCAPR